MRLTSVMLGAEIAAVLQIAGMKPILGRGRYRAGYAETGSELAAAQALRHRCFATHAGVNARPGRDTDAFDAQCRHVLITEAATDRLVCTFRLLPFSSGDGIDGSYAAQFYDLGALRAYAEPVMELGRFCTAPEARDPDILRLAWAAITLVVDDMGVALLFGCSSFAGTDAAPYRAAFDLLAADHLAPPRWTPKIKARQVIRFGESRTATPDRLAGLRRMPPLLKTYVGMGGWVSDHAVVDHDFNTLHVFTGLEIAAIPTFRARALRSVAAG